MLEKFVHFSTVQFDPSVNEESFEQLLNISPKFVTAEVLNDERFRLVIAEQL